MILTGFAVALIVFLVMVDWPPPLVDLLLAVAALANAAGYVWNLYQRFWWFDDVIHCYTIFALTLPLGLYTYHSVLGGFRNHHLEFILVIASLGVALGVLWEVGEWVYDLYVAGNVILGKTDTIIDLVVDAVGATLAGALSVWVLRKEPSYAQRAERRPGASGIRKTT